MAHTHTCTSTYTSAQSSWFPGVKKTTANLSFSIFRTFPSMNRSVQTSGPDHDPGPGPDHNSSRNPKPNTITPTLHHCHVLFHPGSEIMCKPKIMPIKSMLVEKYEDKMCVTRMWGAGIKLKG